jgi:membrane-bound metal-dependent hydrolase YbcI (DUF457 family)
MSPIEHFIIAVIPVGTAILLFTRRRPPASVIGAAFVGSQFPDLIDKPLAFYSGAIPTGRVFMHSLPVAIPFLLAVGVYGWRTNTNMLSLAFVFGHLSHIIGDTYQTLLGPNPALSPDLLWPFVDPIARPEIPHWAGPNSINVHLWTVFSLAVLGYTTWWVSTASEQD